MQSRNTAGDEADNTGARVGNSEVTFEVGVVVERRPAMSRWIDWVWKPVAVLEGVPKAEPFTRLSEEPDGTATYYLGARTVTLYRKETDAYLLNLSAGGALYVVLRPSGHGDVPWAAHVVTASPYDAEVYTISGEEIMEQVPMPAAVRRIVEAFCEAHPYEEVFEKRKRNKARRREKHLFGKEPIFKQAGRASQGGGHDGD